MESLYNPDSMTEDEIKSTFVARGPLLDRLVTLIRHQPEGAGVQHVVLIAPRGMGKTTLLLMLQYAIAEEGLSPSWLALRFPEELYGVTDLADFWLEVLDTLSRETNDDALARQTARLKEQYPDSARLQDAALALIQDWCREHARRLVLLVDNLNLILGLTGEQEEASLRRVLMNEGFLMLVGAAPSFFQEATDYQLPLYQFFKTEQLRELTFEEIQDLLRRRAAADGLPDFETTLRENASRLRVLEYFTGGNPRLVLMLYRVITQSDIHDVRVGLEMLLDQATPYYKAKTESLPPQQRKILDQIARVSSQTHEGVTPKEIGAAIRLSPQVVSAQLKRLTESGYVRSADLRGRSSFYTLSEPLYALWYQMRFGRDARQKMQWLVTFLKNWYDARELREEDRRLEGRFRKQFDAGSIREARETLENRRYLAEAADEGPQRIGMLIRIISGYLQLDDKVTLKNEALFSIDPHILPVETLNALVQAGSVDRNDIQETVQKSIQGAAIARQVAEALQNRQFDKVLSLSEQFIDLIPSSDLPWYIHAIALRSLNRNSEALISINTASDFDPSDKSVLQERGLILLNLGNAQEAQKDFSRILETDTTNARAWYGQSRALAMMGQHDKALAGFGRAIEIKPDYADAWFERGKVFAKLGEAEKAIQDLQHAVSLDRRNLVYVSELLSVFSSTIYYQEAMTALDTMLEIASEQNAPDHIITTLHELRPFLVDVNEKWHIAVAGLQQASPNDDVLRFLINTVNDGHMKLVRRLVSEADMETEFFPLARALDYLLTGDAALLEKLSPEVRPIVDQLVADLQPKAVEGTQSDNNSKTKRRTAKRLG